MREGVRQRPGPSRVPALMEEMAHFLCRVARKLVAALPKCEDVRVSLGNASRSANVQQTLQYRLQPAKAGTPAMQPNYAQSFIQTGGGTAT